MLMVQDKCPLKQALPNVRKYTGLPLPLRIVYGETLLSPGGLTAFLIFLGGGYIGEVVKRRRARRKESYKEL